MCCGSQVGSGLNRLEREEMGRLCSSGLVVRGAAIGGQDGGHTVG